VLALPLGAVAAGVRNRRQGGARGQVFRDLVEAGRKQGMSEADMVRKWKECEQAVIQGRPNGGNKHQPTPVLPNVASGADQRRSRTIVDISLSRFVFP
jgi:hypothetical protein